MGSEEGDSKPDSDEYPQHSLELAEYYIGKYEVTVDQFRAFVEADGYKTTAEKAGSGYTWTGEEWKEVEGADWEHPQGPGSSVSEKGDHPVTLVSWDDAVAFCRWASEETGREVRLPTEAEWEKAARGTDGRRYPWGDESPSGRLLNYADQNLKADWSDENEDDGYELTAPVGNYPDGASPYGALDMAGNVWEWTSSLYKDYPYDVKDGREDRSDRGARVLRGGSFLNNARYVRSADRDGDNLYARSSGIGFRVCASPIS